MNEFIIYRLRRRSYKYLFFLNVNFTKLKKRLKKCSIVLQLIELKCSIILYIKLKKKGLSCIRYNLLISL